MRSWVWMFLGWVLCGGDYGFVEWVLSGRVGSEMDF